MDDVRQLLRPSEVCRRLGVSRSWLYAAAADGRIPSLRLGGEDGPVRFDPAEIERWLAAARAGWRLTDTSAQTLRRAARRTTIVSAQNGQERLEL